jgi:formylglycine-generating enzyme required for sulfatase activity
MARIFLCHASEDKPRVREVYQRLKQLGFSPWLDEEEILPGQDWDFEIEHALETSDFVLVFLSERSVNKIGYVQREFRRAMYRSEEMPEGYIHTIPVKLDDCTVPRRFNRHQWANLNDDGAFARIVRALHRGLEQRGLALPDAPTTDTAPNVPTHFLSQVPEPQPGELRVNSIGMAFVWIPAGTFIMGSPDSDPDARGNEKPAHRVTISKPFYIGKYPVTQAQWEAVMGENPSRFKGDLNRPVEQVSWDDVQAFIRKINERESTFPCRLPTEAEWEYACRAGTTARYSFGDDERQLGDYAWYDENAGGKTHPVGQRKPNAWGLYDMHGNVWEWMQDRYGDYPSGAVTDPAGPDPGAACHPGWRLELPRPERAGGLPRLVPPGLPARRSWLSLLEFRYK